jgi:L-threonylcarbamoyladenylate synthase
VSPVPTVRPQQREVVRAALAEGQVIAVPGYGGYQLAAAPDHPVALERLHEMATTAALIELPAQAAVAQRAEAIRLASSWSNEARLLTDRMWPGPLTVVVPGPAAGVDWPGDWGPEVHLTMSASRPLRLVGRDTGPWAVAMLRRPDGGPVGTADEVRASITGHDVALIVDAGRCDGPGPTVIDCTGSPPRVRHIGALPESFVDAALMMGNRRPRWFGRRAR